MHRLFVAIRPPEEVRDALIDAMDDSPELRWVGDDQLHLTLRFIGEVEGPLADDIALALGRIRFPAFALQAAGVGIFERRSGGALWAAVDPREAVAALAAKVERACLAAGLEPERRALHPHITLARFARRESAAARAFLERRRALAAPEFTANRFILNESRLSRHGPHYEAVASYPLAPSPETSGQAPRRPPPRRPAGAIRPSGTAWRSAGRRPARRHWRWRSR